eukprot:GHVT01061532.1.p1 GENE.GHVT01061532.1~~GHVT01061532.1.p1  ORF type:complete len:133 (+),score=25.58 GHVT01061532.1:84-482(+)
MVSLGDFGGIATTTVVTFLRLPRARGRASPRAAAARAPGLGERQVPAGKRDGKRNLKFMPQHPHFKSQPEHQHHAQQHVHHNPAETGGQHLSQAGHRGARKQRSDQRKNKKGAQPRQTNEADIKHTHTHIQA